MADFNPPAEADSMRELWASVMLISIQVPQHLSEAAIVRLRDSLSHRIKDLSDAPILVLEGGATIRLLMKEHVEIAKTVIGALSPEELRQIAGVERKD